MAQHFAARLFDGRRGQIIIAHGYAARKQDHIAVGQAFFNQARDAVRVVPNQPQMHRYHAQLHHSRL